MSTSDRRRKADHSDPVEEPRALIVDTMDATSEESTPNIARRRKGAISAEKGPFSGLKKYIKKDEVGRIVSTLGGQTERLYEEDWNFAVDENGSRIFVDSTKQVSKDADVKHVLMVKKKVFHEADLQEKARQRSEGLGLMSKQFNAGISSKDPFFQDVGLTTDEEFIK